MYRLTRHVHRLRTIGDFLQPTEEERRKMSQMGDISLVAQVVTQLAVAAGLVQEEPPHGRLVLLYQLVEGPGQRTATA